jgi:hypothetical protein
MKGRVKSNFDPAPATGDTALKDARIRGSSTWMTVTDPASLWKEIELSSARPGAGLMERHKYTGDSKEHQLLVPIEATAEPPALSMRTTFRGNVQRC